MSEREKAEVEKENQESQKIKCDQFHSGLVISILLEDCRGNRISESYNLRGEVLELSYNFCHEQKFIATILGSEIH